MHDVSTCYGQTPHTLLPSGDDELAIIKTSILCLEFFFGELQQSLFAGLSPHVPSRVFFFSSAPAFLHCSSPICYNSASWSPPSNPYHLLQGRSRMHMWTSTDLFSPCRGGCYCFLNCRFTFSIYF